MSATHPLLRSDYMPHGYCFSWEPSILWLQVASDLIIALAYFSIPIALFIVARKKPLLNQRATLTWFSLFILSCGFTHLVAIHTLWFGSYGAAALIKAFTAIVSVGAASILFANLSRLLSLPSEKEFNDALSAITKERAARHHAEKLVETESFYRFTLDLMPAGLLVIDRSQSICMANRQVESIFGFEQGELQGRPLSELLNNGNHSQHEHFVHRYFSNPEQHHAMAAGRTVKGRKKDGSTVYIEINLSSFSDARGQYAFASIFDVTDVNFKRDALVESSKRIQRAIDATKEGIWQWSISGNETWYSDRMLRMINAEPNEAPAFFTWIQHVHPDDLELALDSLCRHLNDKEPFDLTYRGLAACGDYEWFHIVGDALTGDEDEPLLVSGTLENIHKYKQMEKQLVDKTAFLTAILEKSLCGIYLYHLQANVNVYINPAYTHITGYSQDDIEDLVEQGDFLSLFHPDDRDAVIAHMEAVKNDSHNAQHALEYRFKHKDGHWIWCYSKDSLYSRTEDGKPELMLGTFFDITYIKEREEEIRSLARDYQTTFDQAAAGIAHVALDGSWLKVNDRLCTILGYSREKLLNKRFQELTYPDDLEHDERVVQQLLSGEISQCNFEKRYIGSDGEIIWANVTGSVVRDAQDKPLYFIAIIEDISSRKATQFALAESNAALERFAYSASHDLQEPLRKITSFADRLQRTLSEQNLSEQAAFELGRMIDASSRMREMIESLLELSRISDKSLQKEPVLLSRIVDEAKDSLSQLLQENTAQITLEKDVSLFGDRLNLLHLFQNLISNSIKYRDHKHPPQITLRTHSYSRRIVIHYSDNGIGFDNEFSEQIFEPFRRLAGKEIKGSGMGLALCRQIMKAHGGEITVSSEPGSGTTFTLRFPKEHHNAGAN
jgi:PAS domain S-box-containing protein